MQTCKLISGISVISKNKVLLVKYKDGNKYDHQSGWFLPDDQLQEFEHPEDSAKRILLEQLGVSDSDLNLSFVESFKGNNRSWHLVFHYKTEIWDPESINVSDEISTHEWFDMNALPDKKEVAHHGWALYTIEEITK